jgi:integrase
MADKLTTAIMLPAYQGPDRPILEWLQENPLAVIESAGHLADSTKNLYTKALQPYLEAGHKITDVDRLVAYSAGLSDSTRKSLKSAVSVWAREVCELLEAHVTPATLADVQATTMRLGSLSKLIKVKSNKGIRAHTWLTPKQVKELMATCDGDELVGLRDKVVIGLMVAAGLRRNEVAELTWDKVKFQPVGDRMRTVLEIHGKGSKDRVVPISDKLAEVLDAWAARTGGRDGKIARSLGMALELGDSLSTPQMYNIVRAHGAQIGKPGLACHDLRRTYAQIGYDAGVPITQISILLGHASVHTTQRYLNLDLNLTTTASDFVPI